MSWLSRFRKNGEEDETLPTPDNPDNATLMSQKVARLAVAVAGISIAYGALITPYAIYQQENVKVITKFVYFNPETAQVVDVEQGTLTATEADLLMKKYLITYVTKRETINPATRAERWEWIRIFTEREWYNFWQGQVDPVKNKQSPVEYYRQQGMTREVQYKHYVPLPNSPNTYEIDFEAIDRYGTEEVARTRWKATLVAVREDISASVKVADTNPLGVTVYDYILSERM